MTNEENSYQDGDEFVLFLFIAGTTPRSQAALRNVKQFCEDELKGRYRLQVIDIYQQPELAKSAQIVAVPTLLKKFPAPLQMLIGDMSDKERVMVGLQLKATGSETPTSKRSN